MAYQISKSIKNQKIKDCLYNLMNSQCIRSQFLSLNKYMANKADNFDFMHNNLYMCETSHSNSHNKHTISPYTFHLILVLLFCICTNSKIALQRITLNQLASGPTNIVFSQPFTTTPQYCIIIQSFNIPSTQLLLQSTISSVSTSRITNALFDITIIDPLQWTTLYSISCVIMLNDELGTQLEFSIATLSFSTVNPTVSYQYNHLLNSNPTFSEQNQYKLVIFPFLFPSKISITSTTSSLFTLSTQNMATTILVTSYQLSFVVVSQTYISNKIFIIFDEINKESLSHTIITYTEGRQALQFSDENTLLGLNQITLQGTIDSTLDTEITKYEDYGYSSNIVGSAINIGYYLGDQNSNPNLASLSASLIVFSLQTSAVQECSTAAIQTGSVVPTYYYTYQFLYETLPIQCSPCNQTCNTCIGSPFDPQSTSQYLCTSCQVDHYYIPYQNQNHGQCRCLPGLQDDPDQIGACLPCQFNCLIFTVDFMRSEMTPQFILIFTKDPLTFDQISIQNNLKVSVGIQDQQDSYSPIKFKISPKSSSNTNIFIIEVDPESLSLCQTTCSVKFLFSRPELIHTQDGEKYLTKQQQQVKINNYFTVDDRLPDQLNQAFMVTGALIGAASATGQTSMIKMLFQLEQIITFHKYLNMELPVVFKQFIQALSSFQFMDLTFFIPQNSIQEIKNISSNQMDSKGPAKAVFYDNGVNYFKNMAPILISFIIVIIVNGIIYFITRSLPCRIAKRFSQKLRVRFSITLSDMVESMALPAILYAFFQNSYQIFSPSFTWVYFLSMTITVSIIVCPFAMLAYNLNKLKRLSKNDKKEGQRLVLQSVLEDLFQDCQLQGKFAVIIYLFTFFRKFFLAMFLNPQIPGILQIGLLLMLNIFQIYLIIYMVSNNLYRSKLKIITRSINLICIISIEILVFAYNMNYLSISQMILIGVTCTYLTIIATIAGIVQILIKIMQTVFQRIALKDRLQEIELDKKEMKKNMQNRLMCYIGKSIQHSNNIKNKKIKITDDELFSSQPSQQYNNQQSSDTSSDANKKKKKLMKRKEKFADNESDNSQILMINSDEKLLEENQNKNASFSASKDQKETDFVRSQNRKKRYAEFEEINFGKISAFEKKERERKRQMLEKLKQEELYKRKNRIKKAHDSYKSNPNPLNIDFTPVSVPHPMDIYKKKPPKEESEMSEIVEIGDDD